MSDHSERLTRQEFFDFLWEVPIAKLATQWSIPSRDIVKLSEVYDVPRPPAGYGRDFMGCKSPVRERESQGDQHPK